MKKLLAVLISIAMLLAFASCGNKPEDVTSANTDISAETITDETSSVENNTETEVQEETTAFLVEETTVAEEEKKTTLAAPSSTEEILNAYNNAINSAYEAKAGFSKTRYTDNDNMEMSIALKAFKSLVEKFVGIGEANKYSETVTKGQWETDAKKEYLRKSTLTTADINSATCKQEGNYYIITLKIKDGSSLGDVNHTSSTSPIDKCGLCVGNEDKGYYDHKSGPVVYDAIAGTYEGAKISEKYSNATAVAKIDSVTGNLVSLNIDYDMAMNIDISIGSGTATATTHIIYKDFKY